MNDTRIEGEAKGFVRKYVPRIRFDARRKTVEISNFEYIDTLSWLIHVCFVTRATRNCRGKLPRRSNVLLCTTIFETESGKISIVIVAFSFLFSSFFFKAKSTWRKDSYCFSKNIAITINPFLSPREIHACARRSSNNKTSIGIFRSKKNNLTANL